LFLILQIIEIRRFEVEITHKTRFWGHLYWASGGSSSQKYRFDKLRALNFQGFAANRG
jgi:hypothetical protein